ncbi:MAG: hypothetical protein DRI94_08480 [Bacteroidetes bacterium]|nr:MAG: hypothetical protein DRI94_08480 [Bacteroidota bacterium]
MLLKKVILLIILFYSISLIDKGIYYHLAYSTFNFQLLTSYLKHKLLLLAFPDSEKLWQKR